MPGLTGYLDLGDASSTAPSLSALTDLLRHEGDERVTELPMPKGSALAVVDLGVDGALAGVAHRPERGIRVAYYGEFDNDRLDRCRDGAAVASGLADLYERQGEAFAWKLRGTFVLFIRDDRRGVSMFFNDHYASRPLLFGRVGRRLLVSPELKSFCRLANGPAIDAASWVSFLVNGHLLAGKTYLDGVRSLPPGSVLRVEGDTFEVVRYHSHTLQGDGTEHGEKNYVDELSALLMNAVRRRLRAPETTVIPISGGWDSRGILACARKLTDAPLRTVSWGTREDEPNADAAIGRMVAEKFGTQHLFLRRETADYERSVKAMVERTDAFNEDPAFHAGELAVIRTLRREHGVTHMLRGDECFGFTGHTTSQIEALARVGVYALEDTRPLASLLREERREALANGYAALVEATLTDRPNSGFDDLKDHVYFHQRLRHHLNTSSYYKLTALDVTNPLLDRDVLDFVRRLPTHYRIEKGLYKKTLQVMFPEAMSVPMASAASLEDWGALVRNDETMRAMLRRHLVDERNGFHDLVDPDALRGYVDATLFKKDRPRLKVRSRVVGALKSVVGVVSPAAYQRLKTAAMPHVHTRELPPERLLLRMLVAKLWFDRFA